MAIRMLVCSESNLVQFAHVKDVIQGLYLVLKNNLSHGQSYFISEGKWYTYSEVYLILSGVVHGKPPNISLPKQLAKGFLCPVHFEGRKR